MILLALRDDRAPGGTRLHLQQIAGRGGQAAKSGQEKTRRVTETDHLS